MGPKGSHSWGSLKIPLIMGGKREHAHNLSEFKWIFFHSYLVGGFNPFEKY